MNVSFPSTLKAVFFSHPPIRKISHKNKFLFCKKMCQKYVVQGEALQEQNRRELSQIHRRCSLFCLRSTQHSARVRNLAFLTIVSCDTVSTAGLLSGDRVPGCRVIAFSVSHFSEAGNYPHTVVARMGSEKTVTWRVSQCARKRGCC